MANQPHTRAATPPELTPAMLKDNGLFAGLDDETLEILARKLPVQKVEAGAIVVEEHDTSQDMFIVFGGELEVVKQGREGNEMRVAMFGPGDWFGEMAILDVQPRSATVRSVAPTVLARMGPQHVDEIFYRRNLKAFSLLLMNVARELSRRLRVADGILAQFVTTVSDAYSHPRNPG